MIALPGGDVMPCWPAMDEQPREDRAARRRRARAERNAKGATVGSGNVGVTSSGVFVEARPTVDLPPKVPGQHRYIAAGAWVLTAREVAGFLAGDGEDRYLDNENLFQITIGCWDCEVEADDARPGTPCPAGARGD